LTASSKASGRTLRTNPTMSSAMPFRRFAHDVRMLQQQVCSTGAGLK
jgi:hypothetical protein